MKKILTPLFALISVFAFGQYYNGTEYRVVHKNDSAIISGVGQIRYDQNAGKLRFGNGTAWSTPITDASSFLTTNGSLQTVTFAGTMGIDLVNSSASSTLRFRNNGASGMHIGSVSSNTVYFLTNNQFRLRLSNLGLAVIGSGSEFTASAALDVHGNISTTTPGFRLRASGSLLATPVEGVLEYVTGDDLYFTIGSTRYRVVNTDDEFPGSVQCKTVSVSSAEILNINSSPKTIIAAPGSGKFIQVISIMGSLDFVSAAYATNFQLDFRYNNGGTSINSTAWNIAQTEDKIFRFVSQNTATGEANASIINQPITLSEATGNPTTGDGTLKVYIVYRIVDL